MSICFHFQDCRQIQKQLRNQTYELSDLPVKKNSNKGEQLVESLHDIALLPEITKKNSNQFGCDDEVEEYVSWTYWLTLPSFYFYGLIYTAVRMLVNVQTVNFFPLNFRQFLVSYYLLFTNRSWSLQRRRHS